MGFSWRSLIPATLAVLWACTAPPQLPLLGQRVLRARAQESLFSPLPWPGPTAARTAAGLPGENYWQQEANYSLQARFEPATRRIEGSGRMEYVNHSPDELAYLWLNLDANVFREGSLGVQIGERGAIAIRRGEGEGLLLQSVSIAGLPAQWSTFDTLARVELPRPLSAHGGSLQLDFVWQLVLPEKVFRRFGIERVEQGEIFQVAQWFPNVAVYDDVHGWNTLPYLGSGEFYTNFGDYDVRLTVPWDQIVVATGELQNEREVYTAEQCERWARARAGGDTVLIRAPEEVVQANSRPANAGELTWHFRAERVRTFAFACSNAFVLDAANADGTLCISAYPKEALPLWSKSSQMLRAAIGDYSKRWLPYPYPTAINVNGPEAGMEYPMIVFCGERSNEAGLYGLTAHEIGHGWFPMVVNTDERRHMWMDEGLNTFINYYADAAWHGEHKPGRGHPPSLAPRMLRADLFPIETPPDRLPPGQLGELQYTKAAAGLVLLREVILGPERFDYAFRTYLRQWAFRSPRPADFFRCIESAAGADLAWFWRGWFYETGWLDQALVGLDFSAGDSFPYLWIENRAELVMPVHLRIVYGDGTSDEIELPVEVWFHSNRIRQPMTSKKPICSIQLDPLERLPDVDRTNNTLGA